VDLINHYKDRFNSLLSSQNYPSDWTYEDQILVLISPIFRKHVDLYYSGNGLQMIQIFSEKEINRIDKIISSAVIKLLNII